MSQESKHLFSPHTGVKEIAGNTVVTYNVFTRNERRIDGADTVTIAWGAREENALYDAMKDKVKEIHKIGEPMACGACMTPRGKAQ